MLVNQAKIWHALASSVMALLWAVTRVRPWSLRVLGALDVGSLLWAGSALAMMAAQPDPKQLMAGLFALSVTMMARAVLDPVDGEADIRAVVDFSRTAAPGVVRVSRAPGDPAVQRGAPEAAGVGERVLVAADLGDALDRDLGHDLRAAAASEASDGDRALHARGADRHRRHGRGAARAPPDVDPTGGRETREAPGARLGAGRDPELRLRRFEREARATAGLKSPNTVQLYDFGMTDDGTLYYVMELLDGMDLDTLVERFLPVPPERAVHLLLQVCASLDVRILNGLVYRHIKPGELDR